MVDPSVFSGAYAIVGAAAMLSGVQVRWATHYPMGALSGVPPPMLPPPCCPPHAAPPHALRCSPVCRLRRGGRDCMRSLRARRERAGAAEGSARVRGIARADT